MRRDDRADVADTHLAVQVRERGLDCGFRRLGVRKAIGMADKRLACVVFPVLGVPLHRFDRACNGVFLAAHLVIGDDAALVVLIADAVDLIGVEQDGDAACFTIGVGEINGGLAGKNKAGTQIKSFRESMMVSS